MRSKTKKTTDAVVGNHIGWHIHYLCLLFRGQSSRCLCLLPVVEEGEVVEEGGEGADSGDDVGVGGPF